MVGIKCGIKIRTKSMFGIEIRNRAEALRVANLVTAVKFRAPDSRYENLSPPKYDRTARDKPEEGFSNKTSILLGRILPSLEQIAARENRARVPLCKEHTDTNGFKAGGEHFLNKENNMKELWKNHFGSVLACEDTVADGNVTATEYMIDDGNESEITMDEILKALKRTKVGKAAGYGRTSSEILRGGRDTVTSPLYQLFNKC
ncbi:hypothetical protein EVAR_78124_1 [Eumeta japonica]|uniref:Uncharacterized protein n=1 Tax=Eumeta variegata TaxID=151549 RepID=A0A4C1T414_EUMVA|nr:hypothetical protein EVAR_78124_1 [Eumeta japonica]